MSEKTNIKRIRHLGYDQKNTEVPILSESTNPSSTKFWTISFTNWALIPFSLDAIFSISLNKICYQN